MQLTLGLLEPSPPQQRPSDQLDAEARADALKILARIIAQALQPTGQMEASDE
jgi:hypothetical protein